MCDLMVLDKWQKVLKVITFTLLVTGFGMQLHLRKHPYTCTINKHSWNLQLALAIRYYGNGTGVANNPCDICHSVNERLSRDDLADVDFPTPVCAAGTNNLKHAAAPTAENRLSPRVLLGLRWSETE